jgi:hypothetical protein
MSLKVKILIAATVAAALLAVTTACTKNADGPNPTTAPTSALTTSVVENTTNSPAAETPTDSSSIPTTSEESTRTSPAASTGSSSRSASPSTKNGPDTSTSATTTSDWKPPDYGTAQPAVAAYLALIKALDEGLADPAHPPHAAIYKYSAGQGYDVITGSIADENAHGTAWRGTPDQPRVLVASNKANASPLPQVTLSDCPLPSDTWEQYVVKTGKAVPQQKQSPPPPYTITALMLKIQGAWVMAQFELDGSKTCTR